MKATEQRIQAYLKKIGETNKVNTEKVELATIPELLNYAKNARKIANKAKISIKQLKQVSLETADAIDNFKSGPYFEITQNIRKIQAAAKELGLENSPELRELEAANEYVIDMRGQLGNGRASVWFKAIRTL